MNSRTKLNINWEITPESSEDRLNAELEKFSLYLKSKGYRDSTITLYLGNAYRYLRFANTARPTLKNAEEFSKTLLTSQRGRSTLNQYFYAIKSYHEMLGNDFTFKRIKPNNIIPYYFTAEDIEKIFSVINNLKHLAIFKTMFYGCLRVTELINLKDEDLNLNNLSILVKEGKGGKDGIVYITNSCANVLKEYLKVRPKHEIGGKRYLFFTDYGNVFKREDLHSIFTSYKIKAGINKRGGLHVFSRHSPATIMIASGCDIRIVKDVLRHEDIRTTLRYAHVSDTTKRQMYDKYLIL